MQSEEELLKSIRAGQIELFGEVIKKYGRLVKLITDRMMGNNYNTEDLVQDIFIKVYENLSSFRQDSKLSTWIGKIAHTTCLKAISKNKREFVLLDDSLMNISVNEQKLNGRLDLDLLDQGIMKLPEIQRTIFSLFHQEELTLDEIHSITELPIGTIKSHLHRSRIQLKNYLLKHHKM